MSLIVLDSKGQDPAEFENHFGNGIKLPPNAEVCLVGSNLNYKQNGNDETTIMEGCDTFTVQYGNVVTPGENESGAFTFKLKHGTYSSQNIANMIDLAFQDSGIPGFEAGIKPGENVYSNQPISPLRDALNCVYDLASFKLNFACERRMITQISQNGYTNDEDAQQSFFTSYGKYGSRIVGSDNQLTDGLLPPARITVLGFDDTYANWQPPNEEEFNDGGKKDCLAILNKYPLWTHTTGAAPLLPVGGTWGGTPRINPNYCLGNHWLFDPVLSFASTRDKLVIYMGGIVSNKRVGVTGWGSQQSMKANNTINRQSFEDWANGGVKYDIWWEIEANVISSNWKVKFYYHPLNKEWKYENRIQFGEGALEENGANQISLIPKNGTCGTDPLAPKVPVVADQDKFIWEARVNYSNTVTAATPNTTNPATLGGFPGYVVVTDGGNFDLYKHLPLYQGTNLKTPRPMLPGVDVGINISTLRHGNIGTQNMSITNGDPAAVVGAVGTVLVDGNQNPFRDINFGFSPVREINSDIVAYINHSFRNITDRYANMAKAIGFKEDTLHSISANSVQVLSGDFPSQEWNESTGIAIIQIPNLPIEGSLGGGSTVWGGSNSACILGVSPIKLNYDFENSNSSYYEPSSENWIKLKNLCLDSLNQLKVLVTDTTGRKLINLSPNTTIWLKIRQGSEDRTLKAGDGHMSRGVSAQSFYNSST